jgi:predicted methyltransferase
MSIARSSVLVVLALAASACGPAPSAVEPTPPAPLVTSAPSAAQPASAPSSTPVKTPSAVAPAAASASPELTALLDAPDRLPEDRMLDGGRKPAELLSFFQLKPGMKVAELLAGGGYTTEMLARAVGPTGKVYGENTKLVLEKFAEKPWSERLKRPVMQNVVRVDRELEDPLPPDAKGLDLVLANLVYHDFYWMKIDRDRMNKAVFAALKSGGVYAIIDHSAKDGAGATVVESLHRIEESELVRDVERAGFKLEKRGDFLKNPADTRDWSTSPRVAGDKRGTSDRFVLWFRRP